MKIVYLGSGEFGIDCLNAILNSKHKLGLVVTQPAQPAGRGKNPRPTGVSIWAKEHSIAVLETEDVNSQGSFEQVAAAKPDIIVVIAFGQKVGNTLINLPQKGTINVHASLLPKYRGAAPINWAIIKGEKQTGVTIISLSEKIDAGDIISQAVTDIGPDETAGELHDRLAKLAAPLLVETLELIEAGKAVHQKQDNAQATKAPKLKKADGFIDFNEPAEVLRRKILGLWPWPGASANYTSKKTGKTIQVTIASADVVENSSANLPPGSVDEKLNVVCGSGALKIEKIKPAGGKLMSFEDFAHGRQTSPGDMFSKIQMQ